MSKFPLMFEGGFINSKPRAMSLPHSFKACVYMRRIVIIYRYKSMIYIEINW